MTNVQLMKYCADLIDDGYMLFSHATNGVEFIERRYQKWLNYKLIVIFISIKDENIQITKTVFDTSGSQLGGSMIMYDSKLGIDFLNINDDSYKAAKQTAIAYSIVATDFMNVLDKGGRPYFEHCLAVCRKLGPYCTEELKHVALLHDYLEDIKGSSKEGLLKLGFRPDVIEAIYLVSKLAERTEIYTDGKLDLQKYYDLIKTNQMATLVKMSDLRHNSDLRRLKGSTEKDLERANKYLVAYFELEKHAKMKGWI